MAMLMPEKCDEKQKTKGKRKWSDSEDLMQKLLSPSGGEYIASKSYKCSALEMATCLARLRDDMRMDSAIRSSDLGSVLHNLTGQVLKEDQVQILLPILDFMESELTVGAPDYYNIVQLACEQGAYRCLAAVLDRTDKDGNYILNQDHMETLFSAAFDEMNNSDCTSFACNDRLLCLIIMAKDSRCKKILKKRMEALRNSIFKDLDHGQRSPLGQELPLYKALQCFRCSVDD